MAPLGSSWENSQGSTARSLRENGRLTEVLPVHSMCVLTERGRATDSFPHESI